MQYIIYSSEETLTKDPTENTQRMIEIQNETNLSYLIAMLYLYIFILKGLTPSLKKMI